MKASIFVNYFPRKKRGSKPCLQNIFGENNR